MISFYHSLVARLYDLAMQRTERLCLNLWRTELLSDLSGDVLEIGAGTGVNLGYYSQDISRLILCEPDQAMRKHLKMKLKNSKQNPVEIRPCPAECLDVADASIDHLVSTLVFCSVSDLQQSIREAFRVLKPGGKLVFMEHVAADKSSGLHFWQRLWQPLWRSVACNCHLTRQTGQYIEAAGFIMTMREEVMLGAPAIAAPMIVGHALRP